MKKRIGNKHAHNRDLALGEGPKTGDHCPHNGWWSPGYGAEVCFITEGSLMPTHEGVAVTWALVSKDPARPPRHDHPALEVSLDSL